jgi:hypothetical protein
MALRVLNLGEITPSADSNQNTPNNPVLHCANQYSSNSLLAIIFPDDAIDNNDIIVQVTGAHDLRNDYTNLEKTEGNVLKVYDSFSQEGLDLSSLTDISTHHFFVMVHSDNHLRHHFAKITEIHTADEYGDSIKFEPSLGNEIPSGVKFKLFKGPPIDSRFTAIGLGIKNDLQDSLHISRPYFWFNKEENELDSNTKYFAVVEEINTAAVQQTINGGTHIKTTFLVSQNYANEIKDYGKFSLNTRLVDNLRILDTDAYTEITFDCAYGPYQNFTADVIRNISNISGGLTIDDLLYRGITGNMNIPESAYITEILSPTSVRISENATATNLQGILRISHANEAHRLPTHDLTDYETSFYNARRDADDLVLPNNPQFTSRGPTRYLHYDYSNEKVNYSYNVIEMNIEESIRGKTSFSEVSIADMMKIYPSKLEVNTSMRVRQRLKRNKLHTFIDTGLFVGPNGAQQITLNNGDIGFSVDGPNETSDYFEVGEEIKINDRLYIIENISVNGSIRLLQADPTLNTVNTLSRLENETNYVSIGTPVINIGDKLLRRAFSPYKKNLIVDFDLINNRHNDLYLVTTTNNSVYNYFKCSSANINANILTFDIELDKYLEDALHLNNDYYLYYEKLNGTIEVLDYYRRDGQSIMKVEGRDLMTKILSPVINSDTLFSNDIVYSSYGVLNDLVEIGYVSAGFNNQTITFKNSSNITTTKTVLEGDRLFAQSNNNYIGFIGTVASDNNGGTTAFLKSYSLIKCGGDTFQNGGVFRLFVARRAGTQQVKNYMFNKALASNILVDSVTSLSGSSNKGLYFTGGMQLTELGHEDSSLVNTSSSPNSKAIGYHLSKVDGDINGADFQAVLGDGQGSINSNEIHSDILMVNTLMDYSVISVSETEEGNTIEIAPYIPATLGRLEINMVNDYDATFDLVGYTLGSNNFGDDWIRISGTSGSYTVPNHTVRRNDSLFIDSIFVGVVLDQHISSDFAIIVLDRTVNYTTGQTITAIHNSYGISKGILGTTTADNKNTHELEIINVGHLHGGKTIAHMHEFSIAAVPLNVELVRNDGVSITSFEKYGNPVYTIYSLEKGNEINYAAAYKVNSTRNDSMKHIPSRKQFNSAKHLPIEARGYFTPTYSNYDDKQIATTNLATYTWGNEVIDVADSNSAGNDIRNIVGNFDTSTDKNMLKRFKAADRLFLFVNSDSQPYHEARIDSLANPNRIRNINNYNIVGILPTVSAGTTDSKIVDLSTTRHSNLDEDYSITNIISSNKDINNLMNIGIMRITEVVVDWALNQIDPENIPEYDNMGNAKTKELFTPVPLFGGSEASNSYYLQSGSYNIGNDPASINIYDSAIGGNIISVNSIQGTLGAVSDREKIMAGDALIAADTGFLIGFFLNEGQSSLAHSALYANEMKNNLYVGEIKRVPKEVYLGNSFNGRGTGDTFIGLDKSVDMLKTAYFNNPAFNATNLRLIEFAPQVTLNAVVTPHSHSSGTTPEESEFWFAIKLYNSNGNIEGYFFWFNVTNADGNQIDTIPDDFANDYTPDADGITYTAVEIPLPFEGTISQYHSALETAFNSVNLRNDLVHGGNTIPDSNATNYGGGFVTEIITKRPPPSNYIQESATHVTTGMISSNSSIASSQFIGADDTGWGKNPSAYYDKWGETLGGTINNYVTTPRKGGTYLPITAQYVNEGNYEGYSDIFNLMINSPKSDTHADISTTNSNEMAYTNFIPVALNGFSIEDGGKKQITAGETFPEIEALFRKQVGASRTIFGLLSSKSNFYNKYAYYMDFGSTVQENPDLPDEANGLKIAFKPRLNAALKTPLYTNAGDYRQSTGDSVYPYSFDTTNNELAWLKNIDLTGCYLSRPSDLNKDNNFFLEGLSFNYVISHEIDESDSDKVILTLDSPINNEKLRIYQPNPICFYDFSPTDISIGYLSSSYTKKPNANECYGDIKSHTTNNKIMDNNDSSQDMEGIGSAYLIVDLSGKVNASKLINTSMQASFYENLPSTVCLSDGEETYKSGLSSKGHNLRFDSLKKLKGIVSISEPITVRVGKDFHKDSTRCLIGNTVSIVQESEELAHTLLENENIKFTSINEPEYPVFAAPNFQGDDLLSAIRFLLNKKDREIEIIDGNFVINNDSDANKYANVLLSEDGKYQVYEFEKQKTTFAFYNEIILYGSSHKAIKKDLRSIKKIGRKTLEVFDNKLITQEDVDIEARNLLKLHSELNESYKVTASTNGLEQIKTGDIIQFELKRENIQRGEYMVLSVSHRLSNLMELELGKYAKSLDDRLVELIQDTKQTKSHLRGKEFTNREHSLETLDEIKIKEIRVLIRKRAITGNPLKLGFGTQLNTSTTPLGFAGGQSVTITNLSEETL